MRHPSPCAAALLLIPLSACSAGSSGAADPGAPTIEEPAIQEIETVTADDPETDSPRGDPRAGAGVTESATLGAGCFWCIEAVLEQVEGVLDVRSGYTGGEVPDPTYEQICTGETGHAEVVRVTFDPARISYEELLDWFWRLHDPSTLNRQGADVGTQYRSAIYYHSEAQREAAERSKTAAAKDLLRPIVTEITEASEFYPAEGYHQDYYRENPRAGYCQVVIRPKLEELGLDD